MNARNELRDCFLSDSRDRFEAAADAYRAEVLAEAADVLAATGWGVAASLVVRDLTTPTGGGQR